MDRHADAGIQELKNKILEMGGLAEDAIANAVAGLLNGQCCEEQSVRDIENKINRLHIRVDEICVKLLATQQPMGSDLRFVVSAIKINADLERIGDQAVNVWGNSQKALSQGPLDAATRADFAAMCPATRNMVRGALDAFVAQDYRAAELIVRMDDTVDSLKNTIFARLMGMMEAQEIPVRQGVDLILVARNFEKIGDHASNVAEDVIYSAQGRDVRHPLSRAPV
jgi:phosphate transport system protein